MVLVQMLGHWCTDAGPSWLAFDWGLKLDNECASAGLNWWAFDWNLKLGKLELYLVRNDRVCDHIHDHGHICPLACGHAYPLARDHDHHHSRGCDYPLVCGHAYLLAHGRVHGNVCSCALICVVIYVYCC